MPLVSYITLSYWIGYGCHAVLLLCPCASSVSSVCSCYDYTTYFLIYLLHLPSVRFQQACGFEYTSKLQRMFQDIGVSKDLNEQFKKHLSNSQSRGSELLRCFLNCSFKSLLTPMSWNMRCSLEVYSKPHACCRGKER